MNWPGQKYVTKEDYNTSIVKFLDELNARREEIPNLVATAVNERMAEIAAATLPTLEQPKETRYEVREYDGVWRSKPTIQEVISLHGKGHEMRVVIEWDGVVSKDGGRL